MKAIKPLKFIENRQLNSLEDTEALAKDIAQQLKSKQVIGLQGEMGSGKTHFVKALARQLGCQESEANSPTYAIHHEYIGSQYSIHHIDLYRLETEEDVESSGFWDHFYDQNSIIVVEWIDRIPESAIPQTHSYLRMEWKHTDNGGRLVKLLTRSD